LKPIRILVTGGGSAGHISPALAVIQTIQQIAPAQNFAPQFLYLGGRRGLEEEQVTRAGIDFAGVETGKLRRYFSWQNFTDAGRVPLGVLQATGIVRRFRPDVVFSTGGYVSVPPVMAARLLRIPILIHEQTVQVGLANRIAARCATKIALSWESAMPDLSPHLQSKAFVTGNPVRPQIFGGDKNEANRFYNFPNEELPGLYITGGSQGSRLMNRAVEEALPELLKTCRIVHQCGKQPDGQEQDYDRLEKAVQKLPSELAGRYRFTNYVREEINHVFAWADLVLSRAGAGTVSELCVLGKPAVYIPLVPTGGDEQTRNAQMGERVGAAKIIKQNECNAARLLEELPPLLKDSAQLAKMSAAAQTLAKPNAAQTLAQTVLDLAKI
jgi:UDP-N-acetylglucosamine--N-acetylmuramyl-(pentapeptide) pyrophosphoryl-undecaprenol N-acetylglucosamine transferase